VLVEWDVIVEHGVCRDVGVVDDTKPGLYRQVVVQPLVAVVVDKLRMTLQVCLHLQVAVVSPTCLVMPGCHLVISS